MDIAQADAIEFACGLQDHLDDLIVGHVALGDDLESGALVQVLKKYAMPATSLQIVYPDGAVQPRRMRALAVHLAAWFENNKPVA